MSSLANGFKIIEAVVAQQANPIAGVFHWRPLGRK